MQNPSARRVFSAVLAFSLVPLQPLTEGARLFAEPTGEEYEAGRLALERHASFHPVPLSAARAEVDQLLAVEPAAGEPFADASQLPMLKKINADLQERLHDQRAALARWFLDPSADKPTPLSAVPPEAGEPHAGKLLAEREKLLREHLLGLVAKAKRPADYAAALTETAEELVDLKKALSDLERLWKNEAGGTELEWRELARATGARLKAPASPGLEDLYVARHVPGFKPGQAKVQPAPQASELSSRAAGLVDRLPPAMREQIRLLGLVRASAAAGSDAKVLENLSLLYDSLSPQGLRLQAKGRVPAAWTTAAASLRKKLEADFPELGAAAASSQVSGGGATPQVINASVVGNPSQPLPSLAKGWTQPPALLIAGSGLRAPKFKYPVWSQAYALLGSRGAKAAVFAVDERNALGAEAEALAKMLEASKDAEAQALLGELRALFAEPKDDYSARLRDWLARAEAKAVPDLRERESKFTEASLAFDAFYAANVSGEDESLVFRAMLNPVEEREFRAIVQAIRAANPDAASLDSWALLSRGDLKMPLGAAKSAGGAFSAEDARQWRAYRIIQLVLHAHEPAKLNELAARADLPLPVALNAVDQKLWRVFARFITDLNPWYEYRGKPGVSEVVRTRETVKTVNAQGLALGALPQGLKLDVSQVDLEELAMRTGVRQFMNARTGGFSVDAREVKPLREKDKPQALTGALFSGRDGKGGAIDAFISADGRYTETAFVVPGEEGKAAIPVRVRRFYDWRGRMTGVQILESEGAKESSSDVREGRFNEYGELTDGVAARIDDKAKVRQIALFSGGRQTGQLIADAKGVVQAAYKLENGNWRQVADYDEATKTYREFSYESRPGTGIAGAGASVEVTVVRRNGDLVDAFYAPPDNDRAVLALLKEELGAEAKAHEPALQAVEKALEALDAEAKRAAPGEDGKKAVEAREKDVDAAFAALSKDLAAHIAKLRGTRKDADRIQADILEQLLRRSKVTYSFFNPAGRRRESAVLAEAGKLKLEYFKDGKVVQMSFTRAKGRIAAAGQLWSRRPTELVEFNNYDAKRKNNLPSRVIDQRGERFIKPVRIPDPNCKNWIRQTDFRNRRIAPDSCQAGGVSYSVAANGTHVSSAGKIWRPGMKGYAKPVPPKPKVTAVDLLSQSNLKDAAGGDVDVVVTRGTRQRPEEIRIFKRGTQELADLGSMKIGFKTIPRPNIIRMTYSTDAAGRFVVQQTGLRSFNIGGQPTEFPVLERTRVFQDASMKRLVQETTLVNNRWSVMAGGGVEPWRGEGAEEFLKGILQDEPWMVVAEVKKDFNYETGEHLVYWPTASNEEASGLKPKLFVAKIPTDAFSLAFGDLFAELPPPEVKEEYNLDSNLSPAELDDLTLAAVRENPKRYVPAVKDQSFEKLNDDVDTVEQTIVKADEQGDLRALTFDIKEAPKTEEERKVIVDRMVKFAKENFTTDQSQMQDAKGDSRQGGPRSSLRLDEEKFKQTVNTWLKNFQENDRFGGRTAITLDSRGGVQFQTTKFNETGQKIAEESIQGRFLNETPPVVVQATGRSDGFSLKFAQTYNRMRPPQEDSFSAAIMDKPSMVFSGENSYKLDYKYRETQPGFFSSGVQYADIFVSGTGLKSEVKLNDSIETGEGNPGFLAWSGRQIAKVTEAPVIGGVIMAIPQAVSFGVREIIAGGAWVTGQVTGSDGVKNFAAATHYNSWDSHVDDEDAENQRAFNWLQPTYDADQGRRGNFDSGVLDMRRSAMRKARADLFLTQDEVDEQLSRPISNKEVGAYLRREAGWSNLGAKCDSQQWGGSGWGGAILCGGVRVGVVAVESLPFIYGAGPNAVFNGLRTLTTLGRLAKYSATAMRYINATEKVFNVAMTLHFGLNTFRHGLDALDKVGTGVALWRNGSSSLANKRFDEALRTGPEALFNGWMARHTYSHLKLGLGLGKGRNEAAQRQRDIDLAKYGQDFDGVTRSKPQPIGEGSKVGEGGKTGEGGAKTSETKPSTPKPEPSKDSVNPVRPDAPKISVPVGRRLALAVDAFTGGRLSKAGLIKPAEPVKASESSSKTAEQPVVLGETFSVPAGGKGDSLGAAKKNFVAEEGNPTGKGGVVEAKAPKTESELIREGFQKGDEVFVTRNESGAITKIESQRPAVAEGTVTQYTLKSGKDGAPQLKAKELGGGPKSESYKERVAEQESGYNEALKVDNALYQAATAKVSGSKSKDGDVVWFDAETGAVAGRGSRPKGRENVVEGRVEYDAAGRVKGIETKTEGLSQETAAVVAKGVERAVVQAKAYSESALNRKTASTLSDALSSPVGQQTARKAYEAERARQGAEKGTPLEFDVPMWREASTGKTGFGAAPKGAEAFVARLSGKPESGPLKRFTRGAMAELDLVGVSGAKRTNWGDILKGPRPPGAADALAKAQETGKPQIIWVSRGGSTRSGRSPAKGNRETAMPYEVTVAADGTVTLVGRAASSKIKTEDSGKAWDERARQAVDGLNKRGSAGEAPRELTAALDSTRAYMLQRRAMTDAGRASNSFQREVMAEAAKRGRGSKLPFSLEVVYDPAARKFRLADKKAPREADVVMEAVFVVKDGRVDLAQLRPQLDATNALPAAEALADVLPSMTRPGDLRKGPLVRARAAIDFVMNLGRRKGLEREEFASRLPEGALPSEGARLSVHVDLKTGQVSAAKDGIPGAEIVQAVLTVREVGGRRTITEVELTAPASGELQAARREAEARLILAEAFKRDAGVKELEGALSRLLSSPEFLGSVGSRYPVVDALSGAVLVPVRKGSDGRLTAVEPGAPSDGFILAAPQLGPRLGGLLSPALGYKIVGGKLSGPESAGFELALETFVGEFRSLPRSARKDARESLTVEQVALLEGQALEWRRGRDESLARGQEALVRALLRSKSEIRVVDGVTAVAAYRQQLRAASAGKAAELRGAAEALKASDGKLGFERDALLERELALLEQYHMLETVAAAAGMRPEVVNARRQLLQAQIARFAADRRARGVADEALQDYHRRRRELDAKDDGRAALRFEYETALRAGEIVELAKLEQFAAERAELVGLSDGTSRSLERSGRSVALWRALAQANGGGAGLETVLQNETRVASDGAVETVSRQYCVPATLAFQLSQALQVKVGVKDVEAALREHFQEQAAAQGRSAQEGRAAAETALASIAKNGVPTELIPGLSQAVVERVGRAHGVALELAPVSRSELFTELNRDQTSPIFFVSNVQGVGAHASALVGLRLSGENGRGGAVAGVADPQLVLSGGKGRVIERSVAEVSGEITGKLDFGGKSAAGFKLVRAEKAPVKPAVEPQPSVALKGKGKAEIVVADTPQAQKLREGQKFNRTEDYGASDVFVQNSRRANDLFNRWLSGELGKIPLQKLMEEMHHAYAGKGEIGKGRGGDYREGGAHNFRAERTREFVEKYFGLERQQDGVVDLPGLAAEASRPGFQGPMYAYPDVSGKTRAAYYKALELHLSRFAGKLAEIDGAKPGAGREKLVDEALDIVVDFGRVAAAFRQFGNGNWGLYGPMINSLVNRLGFEINRPGFLDIILQGASEASLKPFFRDAVRNGKPFEAADGFDPIKGRVPEKKAVEERRDLESKDADLKASDSFDAPLTQTLSDFKPPLSVDLLKPRLLEKGESVLVEYSGPIELTLGRKTVEIVSWSELNAKRPDAASKLNPNIEYYVFDAAGGGGYKALRDGETATIGRETSEGRRLTLGKSVDVRHVRIFRDGKTFEVTSLTENPTKLARAQSVAKLERAESDPAVPRETTPMARRGVDRAENLRYAKPMSLIVDGQNYMLYSLRDWNQQTRRNAEADFVLAKASDPHDVIKFFDVEKGPVSHSMEGLKLTLDLTGKVALEPSGKGRVDVTKAETRFEGSTPRRGAARVVRDGLVDAAVWTGQGLLLKGGRLLLLPTVLLPVKLIAPVSKAVSLIQVLRAKWSGGEIFVKAKSVVLQSMMDCYVQALYHHPAMAPIRKKLGYRAFLDLAERITDSRLRAKGTNEADAVAVYRELGLVAKSLDLPETAAELRALLREHGSLPLFGKGHAVLIVGAFDSGWTGVPIGIWENGLRRTAKSMWDDGVFNTLKGLSGEPRFLIADSGLSPWYYAKTLAALRGSYAKVQTVSRMKEKGVELTDRQMQDKLRQAKNKYGRLPSPWLPSWLARNRKAEVVPVTDRVEKGTHAKVGMRGLGDVIVEFGAERLIVNVDARGNMRYKRASDTEWSRIFPRKKAVAVAGADGRTAVWLTSRLRGQLFVDAVSTPVVVKWNRLVAPAEKKGWLGRRGVGGEAEGSKGAALERDFAAWREENQASNDQWSFGKFLAAERPGLDAGAAWRDLCKHRAVKELAGEKDVAQLERAVDEYLGGDAASMFNARELAPGLRGVVASEGFQAFFAERAAAYSEVYEPLPELTLARGAKKGLANAAFEVAAPEPAFLKLPLYEGMSLSSENVAEANGRLRAEAQTQAEIYELAEAGKLGPDAVIPEILGVGPVDKATVKTIFGETGQGQAPLEGMLLESLRASGGRPLSELGAGERVAALTKLAAVVERLHKEGYGHGDLKADDVFAMKDGKVGLLDLQSAVKQGDPRFESVVASDLAALDFMRRGVGGSFDPLELQGARWLLESDVNAAGMERAYRAAAKAGRFDEARRQLRGLSGYLERRFPGDGRARRLLDELGRAGRELDRASFQQPAKIEGLSTQKPAPIEGLSTVMTGALGLSVTARSADQVVWTVTENGLAKLALKSLGNRDVLAGAQDMIQKKLEGHPKPGMSIEMIKPGNLPYMRHRNGARVVYRELGAGRFEILAVSDKANEDAVFGALRKAYGGR